MQPWGSGRTVAKPRHCFWMENTGSALPLCGLNPATLSLDPHSELLSALFPELHLAK